MFYSHHISTVGILGTLIPTPLTASAITAQGIETRHIEKMVWTANSLSFEHDSQHHRIKFAGPAVKTSLRAHASSKHAARYARAVDSCSTPCRVQPAPAQDRTGQVRSQVLRPDQSAEAA